jgi:prepilin-type N-terminal cleavage/methylation domain-containing protein
LIPASPLKEFPNMTNSRNAARGFTLVELLTVVAIIVLLVAVLVPAIGAARTAARKAATSATISTLSTAIEAFRADAQIGGAYPPSASDSVAMGRLTYRVNTPYPDQAGNPVPPVAFNRPLNLEISGAGLLVWALAGADLLGSPGFKPFRSQSDTWSYSSDAMPQVTNDPNFGAYALNAQRNPARPRVGPLVDLAKVRISRWEQQAQTTSTPGSYAIEAETEVARAIAQGVPKRSYPMFLDGFGYPILYWRADAAGSQICDRRPDDPEASSDKRGVFHYRDNGDLLSANNAEIGPPAPSQTEPLMLNVNRAATNTPHALTFGPYPTNNLHNPQTFEQQQRNHPFAAYLWNKDARSKVTPRKNDSYLLVTPGPDGIYGTGDDIANFDHNGGAIQ